MKNMKIKLLLCFFIISIIIFSACNSIQQNNEQLYIKSQTEEMKSDAEIFAMDTYMKITAYGPKAEKAVKTAEQEVKRLDKLLSAGNIQGEVGQINKNGGGKCSEDTEYLWKHSFDLYNDTNGAFNVMLYPIIEAWGFINKEYAIPSQETLNQLLPLTNIANVEYDDKHKQINFMQEGMKLDFGGIAKGYTSSKIMDIFEDYGIKSAIVNLGGNVQVKGKKVDGTYWRVGIQDPKDEQNFLGVLQVADKAVITSGGYERYFERDGKIYHHILNPTTGKTANSGLISVTVVSEDGALADGLSTSLFVMGKEKAEQYWQKNTEKFQAILVTDDEEIYVTEGLLDSFIPEKKEVHVIMKK